ncbi:uncharacterized protein YjiS (DUF1127 family) [Dongia mobilis]|uniref:Uncharacterized protein YjiS (DUF1127 family) n=1 Tax=Dongia mobilis TaxID=578943 RepID=A0A4R6WME3_9PROT|nr:DUF1127 domain-containing protein [Dongia mobilis]TDQ82169.1 uncharacterized protein YjiS (DUF1127 family) [Dongia mobilis]
MSQTSSFAGFSSARRTRFATPIEFTSLLVASLQAWRERVRSRRDLMRLSEHQLKDIGLSRQDAEQEWQKPFWQA